MLTTYLWIEGPDYNAKAGARKLGLGRSWYNLKGEVDKNALKNGRLYKTSRLCLPFSDKLDHDQHMRQLENRLDSLLSFLSGERQKYGDKITMWMSTGFTVGGDKYFVRSVLFPSSLMAKLVALNIDVSVSGYPCNDDEPR